MSMTAMMWRLQLEALLSTCTYPAYEDEPAPENAPTAINAESEPTAMNAKNIAVLQSFIAKIPSLGRCRLAHGIEQYFIDTIEEENALAEFGA